MNKINFKGLGTKVTGLAAGTVAAGFVQKGVSKLGLSGILSNVVILAAGAFGPDLFGKRSPFIGYAGDAVMVKGINGIMTDYFPSLISGPDDGYNEEVSGSGDYEDDVSGVEDEGFVSGAEENVAGTETNSL